MTRFEAIETLFDEVRLGMHRIVQVSEALHADGPISLGMRGVLEFLWKNGEATVPQIARSRHVTRQHIQSLVNELLTLRLVGLGDNPAHRRSALVGLTREGERAFRRMRDAERRALGGLKMDANQADLDAAARTLRAVRSALEAL
jgi:DNA-binding MarR family transcriptional regulator